jgi:hypothetical protein
VVRQNVLHGDGCAQVLGQVFLNQDGILRRDGLRGIVVAILNLRAERNEERCLLGEQREAVIANIVQTLRVRRMLRLVMHKIIYNNYN